MSCLRLLFLYCWSICHDQSNSKFHYRVIEPAEYAPSGKKTQSRANDAQGAVATGYREPHTYTMPRSEMCLGLKPRMKAYNERFQKCSGRERVSQAAAGRRAACRKGTFY